jgi:mono/diheme cytochrome c family protein
MNIYRSIILGSLLAGCTYYENEVPKPDVPNPTSTLEATYVTTPPNKTSSAYWRKADFRRIDADELVTGQAPIEDGLYNMSGSFNGLSSFNRGKDPGIILKAAYTQDSVYILMTWRDTTYNISQSNWIYNGPTDPNKPGSTTGWTSQRGDDNVILSFEMGSGKNDIWTWSLALSEPLGYAIDKIKDGINETNDAGDLIYERNAMADNRSGPKYEWNETEQSLSRKPAGLTILDPGFFLLNKKTFTGDIVLGDAIYLAECTECHGVLGDGDGTSTTAAPLNRPGQFNRWTFQSLNEFAGGVSHEGFAHYPSDEAERKDLFARLRGFSGIPGYYLANPTGTNSDVRAVSNVILGNITGFNTKGYSVLLIRALKTNHADDIEFSPSATTSTQYDFSISFADNDKLNRIGSLTEKLTFKPKQ